jgi:hypothetical protein
MRYLLLPVALLLGACTVQVTTPNVEAEVTPVEVYVPPPPPPVVSVYVEPPISQPPPIAVAWAPPPMLVESPPPPPDAVAVWVGGYWVWEGDWVWAHGRWAPPPRPQYAWVHPYYENRGGVVIFVTGHWAPPGVVFQPPPPGLHLTVEVAGPGVIAGPRPSGPEGCFVPAPPGSRPGIIIPAPIGTAPAVVTAAPPVRAAGMRITANVTNVNNTVIINRNVTNVTIIAPPSATISGKAVNSAVPAQAHLAASQPPLVRAQAPLPQSSQPIPAYTPGRAPVRLPPAQTVSVVNTGHPAAAGSVGRPAPVGGSPGAGALSGGAAAHEVGAGPAREPAVGHPPAGEASMAGRAAHPPGAVGTESVRREPEAPVTGGQGQVHAGQVGESGPVSRPMVAPATTAPLVAHPGTGGHSQPVVGGPPAAPARPAAAQPGAYKPQPHAAAPGPAGHPPQAAGTAEHHAAPEASRAPHPAEAKPATKAKGDKKPGKEDHEQDKRH